MPLPLDHSTSKSRASGQVLLVDEDERRATAAAGPLVRHHFLVERAGSALELRRKLAQTPPDVVVLEAPVSGLTGPELCRLARSKFEGPIVLFVSDPRSREAGLQAGADDCLFRSAGPFALLARIQALLGKGRSGRRWAVGRLILDESYRRATVDGKPLALSDTEFGLLLLLAEHQGELVGHDHLARVLFGLTPELARRRIEHRMARLINKLRRCAVTVEVVTGLGYSLLPPESARAAE